jgi:hypothetical protein
LTIFNPRKLRLTLAERQVREAEEVVARQRKVVTKLSGEGPARDIATALLATLERDLADSRKSLEEIRGSG